MSRSEIILDWIYEQVRAGKIKPTEGARLANLVDMTDATDDAEDIKRHLESVNDFRYLTVGAKRDTRGISATYDNTIMLNAIGIHLRSLPEPRPLRLAWLAVALVKAGIFESGIKLAQIRRLLLDMDKDRQKAWGSQSAFNAAFFNAAADMDKRECVYFATPILKEYERNI